MTQRQRVLSTINHKKPDRVPFSWGLGMTAEMDKTMRKFGAQHGYVFERIRYRTEHILTINPIYNGPELSDNRDIWGIKRKPLSHEGGQYNEIVHFPLAGMNEPQELEKIKWPSPDWFDMGSLREETLKQDPGREKARRLSIGFCGNPLEIYTWMTGMEETMINLALKPDLVQAALKRISDFFVAMMEAAAPFIGDLVDIMYFADDLGGQNREIISNDMYNQLIKPHHTRLFARGKALIPHANIMYHTDGSVFHILPELIRAGIEIHEAVQTDAALMEPERLQKTFGDKICFHGAISVQSLLPYASSETVYEEIKKIMAILGQNGGYIAAPSHAIQQGTPPQNVYAMLEAVFGREEFEEICRETK